jgi:TPR repeat protein
MLLKGEGVDMDLDKAFYWLSKASSQNDAQSLYHLGFMYENGIRVGINVQRAVALYKKAAQKGDILAEYSLAMIYKTGKGDIKRDVNQYKKWLTRVKNSKQALAYQASAQ